MIEYSFLLLPDSIEPVHKICTSKPFTNSIWLIVPALSQRSRSLSILLWPLVLDLYIATAACLLYIMKDEREIIPVPLQLQGIAFAFNSSIPMLANLPEELLEVILSMCVDDSSRQRLILSVLSFNNIDSLSGISGVSRVFRRLSAPFLFSSLTFHPNRLMVMYHDDVDALARLRRQHWLQAKVHTVYALKFDILDLVKRLYVGSSALNSFNSSDIRRLTPYIIYLLTYLSNLSSVDLGDTDISSHAPELLDTIQRLPSIRRATFSRLATPYSIFGDANPTIPPARLQLDKVIVQTVNPRELNGVGCPLQQWLNTGLSVTHLHLESGLHRWDSALTFPGLQSVRISAALRDFPFPMSLVSRHPRLASIVLSGQPAISTFPLALGLGLNAAVVADELVLAKDGAELYCRAAKLTLKLDARISLADAIQSIAISFPILEKMTLKTESKLHVLDVDCRTALIERSFSEFTHLKRLILRGFRPIHDERGSPEALVQPNPFSYRFKTSKMPVRGPKLFTFPILLFSYRLACVMPQLKYVKHDLARIYDVGPDWSTLDFSRKCIVQRSSRFTGYRVHSVKEKLEHLTEQDQGLVEYTWPIGAA